MQTFMQSCDVFHTQHANSLLLLIYVHVQCDLAITRNTCVNVYSLNCLVLFLKYKIGQTCLVCVCVCVCVCFGSKCFTFFLLRDVFESLKFCWDLWLSSLFDCIHFCVFLFFEKLFLSSSTAFQQISTDSRLSRPAFLDRSYCIFDPSKYFGICLDSFLIDSRSIEIFCSRQILDNTSTNICQELVLDKFLIALDPSRHNFYKQIQHNFRSHFLQSLSTDLRPFSSQTLFSLSKP